MEPPSATVVDNTDPHIECFHDPTYPNAQTNISDKVSQFVSYLQPYNSTIGYIASPGWFILYDFVGESHPFVLPYHRTSMLI